MTMMANPLPPPPGLHSLADPSKRLTRHASEEMTTRVSHHRMTGGSGSLEPVTGMTAVGYSRSRSFKVHTSEVMGDPAWRAVETGEAGTHQYRVTLKTNHGLAASPWNDVPLWTPERNMRVVCKTPRGMWTELEVAMEQTFTPLQVRMARGQLCHYADNAPWNICMLPQTWADPNLPNVNYGGLPYDGCPLEVVELGSEGRNAGDVYVVKVLGGFGVIDLDKGQLSWKILAIDAEDRRAGLLHDVGDIHKSFPNLLEEVREWLRICHCVGTDGKEHIFGLNERAADRPTAISEVAQAHASWQQLPASRKQLKSSRGPKRTGGRRIPTSNPQPTDQVPAGSETQGKESRGQSGDGLSAWVPAFLGARAKAARPAFFQILSTQRAHQGQPPAQARLTNPRSSSKTPRSPPDTSGQQPASPSLPSGGQPDKKKSAKDGAHARPSKFGPHGKEAGGDKSAARQGGPREGLQMISMVNTGPAGGLALDGTWMPAATPKSKLVNKHWQPLKDADETGSEPVRRSARSGSGPMLSSSTAKEGQSAGAPPFQVRAWLDSQKPTTYPGNPPSEAGPRGKRSTLAEGAQGTAETQRGGEKEAKGGWADAPPPAGGDRPRGEDSRSGRQVEEAKGMWEVVHEESGHAAGSGYSETGYGAAAGLRAEQLEHAGVHYAEAVPPGEAEDLDDDIPVAEALDESALEQTAQRNLAASNHLGADQGVRTRETDTEVAGNEDEVEQPAYYGATGGTLMLPQLAAENGTYASGAEDGDIHEAQTLASPNPSLISPKPGAAVGGASSTEGSHVASGAKSPGLKRSAGPGGAEKADKAGANRRVSWGWVEEVQIPSRPDEKKGKRDEEGPLKPGPKQVPRSKPQRPKLRTV